MRQARAAYFEANGFGTDGGYGSKWVHIKFGPLPLAFPNSAGRVRAVRYHDLHHVLTEYQTDFLGEAEIGAWEVATGCRNFYAAWVLNLLAMTGGLLMSPRRVYRAFARGRRESNLYGEVFDDALLDREVADVRRALTIAEVPPPPRPTDLPVFVAWSLVGASLGAVAIAGLLAPLAVLWWLLRG